jgi:hypothetical protein
MSSNVGLSAGLAFQQRWIKLTMRPWDSQSESHVAVTSNSAGRFPAVHFAMTSYGNPPELGL